MHLDPAGKIRIAVAFFVAAAMVTLASMTASLPHASVHAQEPIDGKKLYDSKCASCHGPEGNLPDLGKALGAKDVRSAEAHQMTDDQMRQLISEGKGNMPAYKATMSADEINATIKYLRTLKMDDGSAK